MTLYDLWGIADSLVQLITALALVALALTARLIARHYHD